MSDAPIDRLLAIMARLRDPERGCPWDMEQSFDTIAPYTVEEAYEVADAILRRDFAELKSELGDLLFQVVFHAQMACEDGRFDFADVAADAAEKMERRHPHVFGDASIEDADAQTQAWERHKAFERAEKAKAEGRTPSVLDGVARGLPALMRAIKLQKRAARVGFDWNDAGPVYDKVEEELTELREAAADNPNAAKVEEEFGDMLFACANLARFLAVDPEEALRRANVKFERRFCRIETLLAEGGRTPDQSDLTEMDRLWEEAKAEERSETGPLPAAARR